MLHRFTIFADYFQFVLMDEASEDDFAEGWTQNALDQMLVVGKTAVCPGTFRNVDVAVEVEILDTPPTLDLTKWDHAVAASLDIPSGKLIVAGCTSFLADTPRIEVIPGTYQLLSLVSGVDSIQNEWEPADDTYRVCLWPGNHRTPHCIKKWPRPVA